MATRLVTGHIEKSNGADWAGAKVRFELVRGTYRLSPDESYPQERITTIADATGDISVTLVSGVDAVYDVIMPSGETFRILVADGAATTLEALRGIFSGIPTGPGTSVGPTGPTGPVGGPIGFNPPFVFNVRDFGATGNGTTDDSAALVATFAAVAAAGGGTLYVPPGRYRGDTFPHPLVGTSNVHMLGVPGQSILDFSYRPVHTGAIDDKGLIRFEGSIGAARLLTADSEPWTNPYPVTSGDPAVTGRVVNTAGISTLTTTLPHGLVAGDWAFLKGTAVTEGQRKFLSTYGAVVFQATHGVKKILSAPTATTFTYATPGADAEWTGGEIEIYTSGTVVAVDTTGYARDDMLLIWSEEQRTDTGNEQAYIGEIVFVERIESAEALILRSTVRDSYLMADNAKIQKITPVENVRIENLTMIGKGANLDPAPIADEGFKFMWYRNVTVRGCVFRYVDLKPISINTGYGALIDHNEIYFDSADIAGRVSGDGDLQYGIEFCVSESCTLSNNLIHGGRHCIDSTNSLSFPGLCSNVIIAHNHLEGSWQNAIATHLGIRDLMVTDNTINGCHNGIVTRGGGGLFANNRLTGCVSTGIDLAQYVEKSIITGNILDRCRYGITMAPLGATNDDLSYLVGEVIIDSNVVTNGQYGIYMSAAHDPGILTGLHVTNNVIQDMGLSGILLAVGLTSATGPSGVTANIIGNTIRNVGMDITQGEGGIRVVNGRSCIIADNHITLFPVATAAKGIFLTGTANTRNNRIYDNIVEGNTLLAYDLTGVGNVLNGYLQRLITIPAAVVSTAAETLLAPVVVLTEGSLRRPRMYRMKASGVLGTDATVSPTLEIEVKADSTVLWSTGAQTIAPGLTNMPWQIDLDIVVLLDQATVNLDVSGWGRPTPLTGEANTAAKSVSYTADHDLGIYATWSVSDAQNTIQLRHWTVEQVG